MHELSIAASIVEAVTETAANYPGSTVKEIRLRLGALSDVVEDSLRFCWELTVEGTPLAGAQLVVMKIPVVVHCAACNRDVELESVQSFRCPLCGELAADLRQGKELEIESIEIDDPRMDHCMEQTSETATPEKHPCMEQTSDAATPKKHHCMERTSDAATPEKHPCMEQTSETATPEKHHCMERTSETAAPEKHHCMEPATEAEE